MIHATKEKVALSVILLVLALSSAYAEDYLPVSNNNYTQEIVLIAIVPPASEVRQVVSTNDAEALTTAIRDLYIDNGVVINLINMSPDLMNEIIDICISKIAEEINRGAFNAGSSAGLLIRTSNSQFKISHEGVAYTALDSSGKLEIKTIIKSLVDDYSISDITYAKKIQKVTV